MIAVHVEFFKFFPEEFPIDPLKNSWNFLLDVIVNGDPTMQWAITSQ